MSREAHVRFREKLRVRFPWLTRRVVTCSTRAQARAALEHATKILNKLGVTLNKEKTKIVNVRQGFEFLGYKIKRGSKPLRLPAHKIKSGTKHGALYAYPKQKSITHFRDQVRNHTQRKSPRSMQEIVETINPIIRGWGNYYCKSHVRKLFAMLDRWIVRRLWSQRYKRWRNSGWKTLPTSKLRSEFNLVSLIHLIPSLNLRQPVRSFVKAGCGKTARPV